MKSNSVQFFFGGGNTQYKENLDVPSEGLSSGC
jgi:hypothetical protein